MLFCLGGPATASAAGYHVDLIVVLNRQATPEIAAAARSAGVQGPRAVDIADKAGLQRAGITLLGADRFGLEEEWRKLRSSRFNPVLRLSWQQAPKPTATALRIRDNLRYRIVSAPAPASGIEGVAVPATPPIERQRIDGSLLLQQSAGLRVAFNLNYSWPAGAAPHEYAKSSGTTPVSVAELMTVTLHGEKRINLNQNYFFDHPVLGVLLRVSPS